MASALIEHRKDMHRACCALSASGESVSIGELLQFFYAQARAAAAAAAAALAAAAAAAAAVVEPRAAAAVEVGCSWRWAGYRARPISAGAIGWRRCAMRQRVVPPPTPS